MSRQRRALARELACSHLESGDPLGWFEPLYARAAGDPAIIPWADRAPNPNVVSWLERHMPAGSGRALKIGSGLGDDAEELARRGFRTTAFDISESAILWSRRRFPRSSVAYRVVDLFASPERWRERFQFVLESYTLQVLPPALRPEAIRRIASFAAPGGIVLVVARGREPHEPEGDMPWPLTRDELTLFGEQGLTPLSFEAYLDGEEPPVRRFRAAFGR